MITVLLTAGLTFAAWLVVGVARDVWRHHMRRREAFYRGRLLAAQAQASSAERRLAAIVNADLASKGAAFDAQLNEIFALPETEHPPLRYSAGRWYAHDRQMRRRETGR